MPPIPDEPRIRGGPNVPGPPAHLQPAAASETGASAGVAHGGGGRVLAHCRTTELLEGASDVVREVPVGDCGLAGQPGAALEETSAQKDWLATPQNIEFGYPAP